MRLIGMGTEGYTKYLQRPNKSVLLITQLKLKPPTRTGQPKSNLTYSKRDAAKAVNTVRLIAFRSQEQESVSYAVVVGLPGIPPSCKNRRDPYVANFHPEIDMSDIFSA